MKKLWVGLIVGLLATASPAAAQESFAPAAGSQDPLSLITKGMILPYFGGAAGLGSFMEVYAPVSGGTVHMFFFNETCVRTGDSAQVDLTTNDVEILQVDNITAASSGLITAAGVDSSGFTLSPDNFPPGVHARVLWVTTAGRVRILDPIALSTVDNDRTPAQTGTWNAMRTGATFFAPLADGALTTTLYLVCPNTNIQRWEPEVSVSGAFDPDNGFPVILPALRLAPGTTPLRLRVYDDEEKFLRDVNTTCNCLTTRPVADISTVYASATDAPQGTYSEVFGEGSVVTTPAVCNLDQVEPLIAPGIANPGNDCPLVPPVAPATVSSLQYVQEVPAVKSTKNFSFTGYRAVVAGDVEIFGRLNNGCSDDIAGVSGACERWQGR